MSGRQTYGGVAFRDLDPSGWVAPLRSSVVRLGPKSASFAALAVRRGTSVEKLALWASESEFTARAVASAGKVVVVPRTRRRGVAPAPGSEVSRLVW